MLYTQVQLSLGDRNEAWWLPIPPGKAKVGEKITRFRTQRTTFLEQVEEYWTITQVCTTLQEEQIRELIPNARMATDFHRTAETVAYMAM